MIYKIKILLVLTILMNAAVYAQSDSVSDRVDLKLREATDTDTTLFNVFPKLCNEIKIGLVLSGGGARGLTQIGVLRVLEKYGIQPDLIVGTSIGAIVGGLYASGYTTHELDSITNSINWKSKLRLTNKYQREFLFLDQKKSQDKGLLVLSFDGFRPVLPTSLSSGQELAEIFNILLLNARYTPKKSFASLKIPFFAVATDFDKGSRVILKEGNLSEAIKASFTFPLLYSPMVINGRNLVDGGLTANIPVDVARNEGADFVITVNSTSPLNDIDELRDPLNNADQVLTITMAQLNEEQLKKSDLNITPDIGKRKSTEFNDISKIIREGEIATENIIGKILLKLDSAETSVSQKSGNFIIEPKVTFQCLNLPDSVQNSIYEEQAGKFVKYTLIERALKKIYRTGFYKEVWAVIAREGDIPRLTYFGSEYEAIKEIKLTFRNGSDIRRIMFEVTEIDGIQTGKITAKTENPYNGNKVRADLEKYSRENEMITEPVIKTINNFAEFRLGKRLNSRDMKMLYENILGALRGNNLSVVDINKFRFDHETGVLEICFTDGGFKEIEIRGNRKTRNNLIKREIELGSKIFVLKADLEKTLRNIYGTELFRQVSIYKNFGEKEQMTRNDTNYFKNNQGDKVQLTQTNSPNLRVNVVEKSDRNLRFSFRADNERKLQLYADFRNENFLGTGNEIGISAQGGLRDREYRFDLKSYRFFNTYLTYGLAAYYKFRDIYQYSQTIDYEAKEYTRNQTGEYRDFVQGGSFLLGSQVGKSATIFAQLFYENVSRGQLQGNITPEQDLKLLKLKFGGKVDSENYFPFPTSGTVANYYYETASEQLSGGFSFTKIWFDVAHNFRLSNISNLKPKIQFGFADKTTPATEMFSLGGENLFYGMEEDELRGRQVLLSSLEYRLMLPIKIFFDTYISARYDLGQMWANTEDIRFKDLRHGIGMAIRFDTPVGEASFSAGRSFIINKGFSSGSLIWGPYTFYYSIGFNM